MTSFVLPPEGACVQIINPTQVKVLYAIAYEGARETFIIPAGFVSDLASVPQAFQWLINDRGTHTLAAILHDYLYSLCRKGEFSYRDADAIFRRVLREEGDSLVKRNLMWSAVRAGNGFKEGTDAIEREELLAIMPLAILVGVVTVPPIAVRRLVAGLERMEKWGRSATPDPA